MLKRCAVMSVLVLAAAQPAQSQQLFKEFAYGMSMSEVKGSTEAYECEPNVLCLDSQVFMGQPVSLGFQFTSDKLAGVAVDMSQIDDPISQVLMPIMQGKDWVPAMVMNPTQGTSMDLIATLKGSSGAPTQQDFIEYLVGASAAGSMSMTFLEANDQTRLAFQKSQNLQDVFAAVPDATRSFDIVMSDAEASYYLFFYLLKDPATAITPEAF